MIYRFGDFRLDTAALELHKGSTRLDTEPQVLDLLILLVEHRERVVSKNEIFSTIWTGRVVSDAALSSRVKAVRQLLGDDGTRQEAIRTSHGRGFRFVKPVETEAATNSGQASQLPTIQAPTLVIHRSEDVLVDPEAGRQLAREIPGARLLSLPGADHLAWVGDNVPVETETIEAFLKDIVSTNDAERDRVLATVIAVDVAQCADKRAATGRIRAQVALQRGSDVQALADTYLATFDGPARAVRTARAITDTVPQAAIGVHTGEVDRFVALPDTQTGAFADAIARATAVGRVTVSSTVKDLITDSDAMFIAVPLAIASEPAHSSLYALK